VVLGNLNTGGSNVQTNLNLGSLTASNNLKSGGSVVLGNLNTGSSNFLTNSNAGSANVLSSLNTAGSNVKTSFGMVAAESNNSWKTINTDSAVTWDQINKNSYNTSKAASEIQYKTVVNAANTFNTTVTKQPPKAPDTYVPIELTGGSYGDWRPQFAEGGIVDRPTLGLFGEAGREAFVPLDDKQAGWNILSQILPEFGIKPFAAGGIVGGVGLAYSNSPTVNITLHYAPVIPAGLDKDEIMDLLQEDHAALIEEIEQKITEAY
jgi:hypothetical protein